MALATTAAGSPESTILFAIDGQKHEIVNPDPTMALSDYLRTTGHTAVKIGCGEGGCGACTVTVATWDAVVGKPTYRSVNACLLPLCSAHGLSVTTSMGLGNSVKGFHPIQERLAEHNGSQCGFCSPGMVMSIFGMLSSQKGEACPDALKLESCIDGNLCRCTGYRPILAAARSFAGTPKADVAGEKFAPFPDFLKQAATAVSRKFVGGGKEWHSPATLAGLFETLAANVARSDVKTSIVAGHTCRGIYKDDHLIDVLVDVSRVPELTVVEKSGTGLTFGGAITWGRFIETLEETLEAGKPEHAALPVLVDHARKVAGHGIRNMGTLGGNLVMTKVKGFQSDLATILAGVGASVKVLAGKADVQEVSLDTFFSAAYKLPVGGILASVTLPFVAPGAVFKSYRTAIRPINSHALVNAAFSAKVTGGTIETARLVFGAFGSRGEAPGPSNPETSSGASGGPLRAVKAEEAILGKPATSDTLQAALSALAHEAWWPEDVYERHLAQSYLYKYFHVLSGSGPEAAPPLGVSQSSERPATNGTQLVTWATPEAAPIGEAMPKLSSKLQAAGEQRFTNDLPEPKDTLHGAYVPVPRARAVFVGYSLAAAEQTPGFVGVVGAEDIPGKNAWELTSSHQLLLPKGQAAQYAGQPCLLVLADSTKHAEAAARAVKLTLELPQEAPILSYKASLERQEEADKGTKPLEQPLIKRKAFEVKRGDAEAALAAAAHRVKGEIACDGQKAFYMEPCVSLVVPSEDSILNVWGTFQVPAWAHSMVVSCTGLPKHKVVVNTTHIGGGFGGKLLKSLHVICVAAVAALKYRRPVRVHVNRNVDTVLSGGRVPMHFEYEAGFDATGKLSAVRMRDYGDQGQGDGCASFSIMIAVKNMEQIYGIPNLDLEGILCTTNKPGNTAVRGPGEPQAAFLMETIIEHVACELGRSAQEVREANIFTSVDDMQKVAENPLSAEVEKYSAMVQVLGAETFKNFPALGIWTMLKAKVDFSGRAAAVAKFNKEHRWRKRGISMTPVKYNVSVRAQQALVCLYTDGTCLISCDGTEIGQGLHTKVIQYAAYHLSQIVPGCEVPVSDIRVGPTGTDKVAHATLTGGSTTSEGVCEAVKDAIGKLVENLRPVREKMVADGKEVTLKSLLDTASANTELQASGKCHEQLSYHCFGACVSEVEVDVLTGEVVILSSSILYDCGKSLNPTIDLGQCEGAFMMGVGFFLREKLIQDAETGQLATDGTWEYKIPCFQDVPLQFDVEFFPRPFTEGGIMSSKASGEPPLVLSASVFCAVKQAVMAGREEFGHPRHFRLDAPATPRDIALAIGAATGDMKL